MVLLEAFVVGTIAMTLAHLYHEFSYHSVENDTVVVAILGVRDKILDSLRCSIGVQADVNIPKCCMQHRRPAGLCTLFLSLFALVDVFWLLVLDVPLGLADVFLVGEHVEPYFTRGGGYQHGVSGLGFLQQGVVAGSHRYRDETFLLGLALVQCKIQGSEGLVLAVELYYPILKSVNNFDAVKRAV